MGGYAVTKAGLTMMAQSLAVDHAHEGLRANVVCPGWTVTEMADEEMAAFGASRGGLGAGDAYSLVTSLVPQRRAARAEEVAAVVVWLLSDAASYVNGAVIPVDGSASAVDIGTLPFDPDRGPGLRRLVAGLAQHPAQVEHHLLVDVLALGMFEERALRPDRDGHLAIGVDLDRADRVQQRGHRVPLDVVAGRVLEDLAQRVPVTVVEMR
jgi:hypothetical protein